MTRDDQINDFLTAAGWGDAKRSMLAGDASARRYERIAGSQGKAVLMDAPPEPGEVADGQATGYSAIAHLAVDCRPFVSIARHLKRFGFSTPTILAEDVANGLLLLEDLGDDVFVSLLSGSKIDRALERELYAGAVDLLVDLHSRQEQGPLLGAKNGVPHEVAPYDAAALKIETELVVDWYLPGIMGIPEVPSDIRQSYLDAWQALLPQMQEPNPVLCLRDYHAGNLIWLPDREGPARIGLLDFQDAVLGARSYDLMSLLQDARRDVSADLEAEMLDRYIAASRDIDASFDEAGYRARYALLGAQRNAKIVGIFMRLWLRDGKKSYLQHLPRVWRCLERNLTHPSLNTLKAWFDDNVPRKVRLTVPDPEAIAENIPKRKIGAAG